MRPITSTPAASLVAGATCAVPVEVYPLRRDPEVGVVVDGLLELCHTLLPYLRVHYGSATEAHQVGVGRQISVVAGKLLEGQFAYDTRLFQQSQRGVNRRQCYIGKEITYALKDFPNRGMIGRIHHYLGDSQALRCQTDP